LDEESNPKKEPPKCGAVKQQETINIEIIIIIVFDSFPKRRRKQKKIIK
jgi:hypothetical protein